MLYGKNKRQNKRINRKPYRRTPVPRVITQKDYIPVSVATVVLLTDSANQAFDVMTQINTTSQDWITVRTMHAAYKVVSCVIDSSPFMSSPIVASDAAVGFAGIREGYFDTAPATIVVGDLVRYPNVVSSSNCRPFSITRKCTTGGWFNGNSTSTFDSDQPKLIYYGSWSQFATTNTNKGILRIRLFMIARGSQNS